jgi:hypothetical protein
LTDVTSAASRLDVTIQNCNIGTNPSNSAQTGLEIGRGNATANEGIEVRNGVIAGANGQLFINIDNNKIRNFTSANLSAQGIDIDAEQSTLTHATVKRNNVLSAPGAEDYTIDTEAAGATLFLDFGTDDGSGDGANLGVDAVLTNTAGTFNVEGGVAAVAGNNPALSVSTSGTFGTGTAILPNLPPQLALGGHGPGGPGVVTITTDHLPAIFAEAVSRWVATGLSADDVARLQAVSVEVRDLPDEYLGAAPIYGNWIALDVDAAGYGWFVDPTPADDSEFAPATAFGFGAGKASPADGRMDLLTVVMHELGHVIGLDSRYDGDTSDLMYVYLGTGSRRLPGAVDLPGVVIPASSAATELVSDRSENVGWAESSRPTDRVQMVGLEDSAHPTATADRTFADSRIRVGSEPRDSVNWWEVSTELRRARRRATFTANPEFGATDE